MMVRWFQSWGWDRVQHLGNRVGKTLPLTKAGSYAASWLKFGVISTDVSWALLHSSPGVTQKVPFPALFAPPPSFSKSVWVKFSLKTIGILVRGGNDM